MEDRVVVEFENVVEREGAAYNARAVGEERPDGLWEGWVEFERLGVRLTTHRETTQPSRDTLRYWATGLTYAYLEGALERAIAHTGIENRWERALHYRPAPADHAAVATTPARAVLDPFAVYAEGHGLLRDQLGALHTDQLRNIIRAYGMAKVGEIEHMTDWEMRALILQAVERRAE